MCGRVRLSSDVSEIRLVFSIPPPWLLGPVRLNPIILGAKG
jgi:hypothetical protein